MRYIPETPDPRAWRAKMLKIAERLECIPELDHAWDEDLNPYRRCSESCVKCHEFHKNKEWIRMIADQGIKKIYWNASKKNVDSDLFHNIGENLKNNRSILIQGNVGSGKTYLMHCILRALHNGEVFKAYEIDDIILHKIKDNYTGQEAINLFQSLPYLFIDDLGVNRFSERFERDFYSIIDDRLCDEKPTIISTNLSDKDLASLFGERLFSRLKEYIRISYNYADRRG